MVIVVTVSLLMMEPLEPSPSSSKWTPRPLTLQCGVCGAGAADVNHYGSVACYSCRAFFRRAVGEKKKYDVCARGGDNCVIDQVSRTNCKKCRLERCFQVRYATILTKYFRLNLVWEGVKHRGNTSDMLLLDF